MLEVGDRALDVGEGGFEMGEDLRSRLVCGVRRRPGQQLGRRTAPAQCGADLALRLVEAFPNALHGPIAQLASDGAAGGEDAAGDGDLEEPPQSPGGEAEPSDFVGEPDAERPPATGACPAVAAEDAPAAHRLSPRAALVKSVQTAVPIQRADDLAMRAWRLLEPLRNADPFSRAAIKPMLFAHVRPCQRRNHRFYERKRCGVVAGYDNDPGAGCGVEIPGRWFCRNPGVTKPPPLGRQIGNIQPKMRSKRGKGHF
jgi:hypothetical protein